MSLTQGRSNPRSNTPAFSRQRQQTQWVSRAWAVVPRLQRGWARSRAQTSTRRVVEPAGPGAVEGNGGELGRGGRSSASSGSALWYTGARIAGCYGLLQTLWSRWRAHTWCGWAQATVASWPSARNSRARRSPRLQEEIGIGEREVRCGGSQRGQRVRGQGRGRSVAPESTTMIHGDRRGERRCWQRPGASSTKWPGEEEAGDDTDLGNAERERGSGWARCFSAEWPWRLCP